MTNQHLEFVNQLISEILSLRYEAGTREDMISELKDRLEDNKGQLESCNRDCLNLQHQLQQIFDTRPPASRENLLALCEEPEVKQRIFEELNNNTTIIRAIKLLREISYTRFQTCGSLKDCKRIIEDIKNEFLQPPILSAE